MNKIKGLLDDLQSLTVSYSTFLLDPSQYNDAYSSSNLSLLTSKIYSNLGELGTGLSDATLTAIYERPRRKILFEASRTSRRISIDISKRLPYAGMIADKLTEADQDVIWALADINNKGTEEQGRLTYQNQRDKIKEAMESERTLMDAFEKRRDRSLRAYTVYDENTVKDHWQYFDYMMNRAINYAKICADLVQLVSKGADQITFENYLEMSKIMAEGQLRIASMVGNLMPSGQSV